MIKAALVVFPGSNRDRDMRLALGRAMGAEPLIVWHQESELPALDLIVLPGGFAYGDYLRSGAMAARAPVMREVARLAARGVPILGVCNGFQILTEAGLLPGVMMANAGLRFVCKYVHMRVEEAQTIFTAGYRADQVIRVPVAHHDGNYFADPATLAGLADNGQVAFRYCDGDGALAPEANPNGSIDNIAGVFNRGRTILGMMPHPENVTDRALGGTDGGALFGGLVAALS
jgi:phosphoribosylformylglycinamidine synthase